VPRRGTVPREVPPKARSFFCLSSAVVLGMYFNCMVSSESVLYLSGRLLPKVSYPCSLLSSFYKSTLQALNYLLDSSCHQRLSRYEPMALVCTRIVVVERKNGDVGGGNDQGL
jgi:hypothetical protein